MRFRRSADLSADYPRSITPSPPESATGRDRTLLAAGLAILLCLFLWSLMPALRLWDADEGYYARTAAEMLQSGNWLVPTYNGELFAHKPPLGFWLMAVGISIFGEGEFAVRFFSAPAMAASVFLTFLIGRRLFDCRTGLWAMGVLATSLMATYLGFAAMLDAALLFCITLSIWAYVELCWREGSPVALIVVFGLGMYAALLAKGPVGPAVIITTILFSSRFFPARQRLARAQLLVLAAVSILAFLAFLGWALPADRTSAGDLLSEGLGTHVIGRALAPMEGHGGQGPIGYLLSLPSYLPLLLLGFFPWVIHLPAALFASASGTLGDHRSRVLLWSWILPTVVMFTLAATKLPHYIFPIYPPLAIILAAHIVQRPTQSAQLTLWHRSGTVLYLLGGLVTAASIVALSQWKPVPDLGSLQLLFGIAIAVFVILIARAHANGRLLAASRLLMITTPMAFWGLFWLVIRPIEPSIKLAEPMARAVAESLPDQAEIYLAGYNEPSFYYYLNRPHNRPVKIIDATLMSLQQVFQDPRPFVLVAPRPLTEPMLTTAEGRSLKVVSTFSAHNLNRKARFQTMIVVSVGAQDK